MAWRMCNLIRSLLDQDGDLFSGTVEVDEAYIGGRGIWRNQSQKTKAGLTTGRPPANDPFKTQVFGIVQRGSEGKHGKVMAKIVDMPTSEVLKEARKKVEPGTTVYTDEWNLYKTLADTYTHGSVDHSKKVYVSGDVHIQSIDGFWSLAKRGISGVYHGVSPKTPSVLLGRVRLRLQQPGRYGSRRVRPFSFQDSEESADFLAALSSSPKKSLRFGMGISTPWSVVCDGSPSRTSDFRPFGFGMVSPV
jgi:hypothetical protein